MKTDRTMVAMFALAAAGLALVGCERRDDSTRVQVEAKTEGREAAGAVREAGRDAAGAVKEAGHDVADAASGAAGEVHAEKQEVDVKTALTLDTTIDASNIEVESNTATKTIVLKGSVPTADQKTRAEATARAKAEGYTIDNQLMVGGATGATGATGVTGATGATGT